MAAVDPSRYDDLCRLCATKTTMISGINLFENEGSLRQISKKIESCLPVHIHPSDELPKMICGSCLYKLDLFFDFRERSIRTERLLLDLIKELNSNKVQEQSFNIISMPMDHTGLIMVPHHQLIGTQHNVQNVEIDLSQLNQREGIIIGHEIVLAAHNVAIHNHSLDGINLNHELANQDLSNHSLQTQDSLLIEAGNSHNIQSAQFSENTLAIMDQQQILANQFRLGDEMQVNINEIESVEIAVQTSSDIMQRKGEDLRTSNEENYEEGKESKDLIYSHNVKNSVISDSTMGNVDRCNNYNLVNNNIKNENPGQEETSSDNALFIDERLNTMNGGNKVFVLQNNDCHMNEVQPISNTNDQGCLFCSICCKSFDNKVVFDGHCEEHFNKCVICLAVFTSEETLKSHLKECHSSIAEEIKPVKTRLKRAIVPLTDENEYSEDSDGGFDNTQLDEVDAEHTDDAVKKLPVNKRKKWCPKICKDCGKTYKTNYKLTEHMRKHTGEKPYKCRSCEKAFRSKIGLAQHEAKHTGQYDFACTTCGKGFQCKSYLMVHQRVHSDIKPYPCTTCGSNFKTKQSLLDHTNRHLGVKPYMCDTCGRGFITKGLCKAHQKVHNGMDNRKYSCKICMKMFVSKSYLQTHLRIHTGEKPFMCEVCGKGFLTRVDLRIHSTMHTGEKSYVCEICGKAFARRDALRCHRRSHTGERPYSCDLCGQTFTQFTPMAIHKRLHTGERPYSCEVCEKTFVSRSTMMSHAKKHVR